ncbi:hypothetical protein SUGI_1082940 [Cryptomeria japonica]|uniref:uncharacterized protein LOC131047350 n=1 Tax=Cryptomeria japonica TaxID=3369 RepID=UPI002414ADCE|nr:uncharacterized protein LOC131047350 [Cryptomeria japonica]XP_057837211.1 uncharacterized protein LOC131047350 [Cryptomeria japonica]XP_057837212.1 uncharacterized protein LOC131047350 [Cryptomeria japonica]GLJ50839.1 hypothetical protein SUGI_1082940 [Cryptomeria japonica]
MAVSKAMGGYGVLKLSVVDVLLTCLAIAGQAEAVAMVMGSVFCDQCRDGHLSLFDVPIIGAKVELECAGQVATTATTNYIGNFIMKLDGTPDLSSCTARATQSPPDSQCNILGSPAKSLSLTFSFFGMELYSVDSLFFYPAKTMSLCVKTPRPRPPSFNFAPPPPAAVLPPPSPPPAAIFPPPPSPHPVISLPPLPFLEPSACTYDIWAKREYNCHWKIVSPDTKVSDVFGLEAGKRYGPNLTLWQGLIGRGDVYKTLLREATAALLNSYTTLNFQYNSVSVGMHMYWALHSASPQYALKQAFSFKKANMGLGGKVKAKCMLKPCK